MATLDKPYCTLAQLQSRIGNERSTDEEWLKECINIASRLIDSWCHTDFWFHDHSSVALEIQRRWIVIDKVWLPWPIITLDEVAIDDNVEEFYTDYNFEVGRKSIVWAGERWPQNKIEDWTTIKGTFGYAISDTETPPTDPSFPQAITFSCMEIAGALSGKKKKDVITLTGDKQSVLDDTIPMRARRMLQRHVVRFW